MWVTVWVRRFTAQSLRRIIKEQAQPFCIVKTLKSLLKKWAKSTFGLITNFLIDDIIERIMRKSEIRQGGESLPLLTPKRSGTDGKCKPYRDKTGSAGAV
ncbi:MAG: hypothetical protein RR035_02825 [Oscillibacter sp.]